MLDQQLGKLQMRDQDVLVHGVCIGCMLEAHEEVREVNARGLRRLW
jgi:hypothetical protein